MQRLLVGPKQFSDVTTFGRSFKKIQARKKAMGNDGAISFYNRVLDKERPPFCEMPKGSDKRRRLAENIVSQDGEDVGRNSVCQMGHNFSGQKKAQPK